MQQERLDKKGPRMRTRILLNYRNKVQFLFNGCISTTLLIMEYMVWYSHEDPYEQVYISTTYKQISYITQLSEKTVENHIKYLRRIGVLSLSSKGYKIDGTDKCFPSKYIFRSPKDLERYWEHHKDQLKDLYRSPPETNV